MTAPLINTAVDISSLRRIAFITPTLFERPRCQSGEKSSNQLRRDKNRQSDAGDGTLFDIRWNKYQISAILRSCTCPFFIFNLPLIIVAPRTQRRFPIKTYASSLTEVAIMTPPAALEAETDRWVPEWIKHEVGGGGVGGWGYNEKRKSLRQKLSFEGRKGKGIRGL